MLTVTIRCRESQTSSLVRTEVPAAPLAKNWSQISDEEARRGNPTEEAKNWRSTCRVLKADTQNLALKSDEYAENWRSNFTLEI